MQLLNVIRAATFRGVKPWLFDKILQLELIQAVKDRYRFVKPDSITPNAPIDFQAGKLSDRDMAVSIEQFVISPIGNQATSLGASTRDSTDASDAFLDDVMKWIAQEYKIETKEAYARSYFSQIEFLLPRSPGEHFSEFKQIGRAIGNLVKGYGLEKCPSYEVSGFQMHFDVVQSKDLLPVPQPFSLERRAGARYDECKFFSQAPLKTQDHRALLEQIEQILSQ